MKKFLLKSLRGLGRWTVEVLKISVAAILSFAVLTMHWSYGFHDNREMRCWSTKLPGYEEYTDWDHGEPKIVRRFSLRATYRLGPWIEPEWVDAGVDIRPEAEDAE